MFMHQDVQGHARAAVSVCSCGKVHFSWGPLTLHFERREFLRFAAEVGDLAAALGRLSADGAAAGFRTPEGGLTH